MGRRHWSMRALSVPQSATTSRWHDDICITWVPVSSTGMIRDHRQRMNLVRSCVRQFGELNPIHSLFMDLIVSLYKIDMKTQATMKMLSVLQRGHRVGTCVAAHCSQSSLSQYARARPRSQHAVLHREHSTRQALYKVNLGQVVLSKPI